MALDVRYGEIRTEVIGKLENEKQQMEELLANLTKTVNTLPTVMEGDALTAYLAEYENIVKKIYTKLNTNLGDFSAQLEAVCAEFEKLDSEMNSELSK